MAHSAGGRGMYTAYECYWFALMLDNSGYNGNKLAEESVSYVYLSAY